MVYFKRESYTERESYRERELERARERKRETQREWSTLSAGGWPVAALTASAPQTEERERRDGGER